MIDLALFRNPAFVGAIVTVTATMFTVLGVSLFTAQYIQLVLGYGPLESALWSLPPFLAMPIGITLATLGVRRARVAHVVGAGLLLVSLGVLGISTVDADGLVRLLLAASVMTIGIGMVTTLLVIGVSESAKINNVIVAGSGTVTVVTPVPSTTRLSILLFPVEEVAPLNTIRKAALALLFRPAILLRVKTIGIAPNVAAGT